MDERDWTDRPLREGQTLRIGACSITRGSPAFALLVSGDLALALEQMAPDAPMLGLCDLAEGPRYAIRMARDQALLVLPECPDMTQGWHDGFALSDARDRFDILHLAGETVPEVLAQGMHADLAQRFPSAAVTFNGVLSLLTRTPRGFDLRVEAGCLTAVTSFLRAAHPIADSSASR